MSFWSEFNASSQEEWNAKIAKDLKGKELSRNTICDPFIFQSTKSTQSKFPENIFLNGDFDLRYSSNENILSSLRYGVNAITLKNGAYDEKLLKNVMHEIIATHIEFSSKDLLQTKESWYAWKNKIGNVSGSFRFDPIAYYIKNGKWESSKDDDLNNWIDSYKEAAVLDFESVFVDGTIYGNAAFSPSFQIAFIAAHLNEYLELIKSDAKTAIKVIVKHAVGVNYFLEIAKLRALRNVLQSIAHHRKINIELIIESETSKTALSPIDVDTNLIRITTTAMASFVGGSNIISNIPHDYFSETKDKNAQRLAINISHIIQEESKVNEISDPLKGSHVIEELTDLLKNESWNLFKNIEKKGGWLNYYQSENIAKVNKENVQKRTEKIVSGDDSVIGFNKYRLSSDKNLKITAKNYEAKVAEFVELKLKKLI